MTQGARLSPRAVARGAMFGHLLRSTLGIAAVILSSSPAFAGVHFPARSAFRPIFVANAGAIPQGTDSVKVELHWEVPYRELAFKKDDRYFRARLSFLPK